MNAVADISEGMPINMEAEQGVLGAILLNNGILSAVSFLKPEHFHEPLNRVIFEAAQKRIQAGEAANALTLAGDLPAISDRDFTPAGYLAHLTANAWSSNSGIIPTARELVKLHARRELIVVASELSDMARAPGASPEDIIGVTESNIIHLSSELSALDIGKHEASPDEILFEVEERRRTGRHVKGIECGLQAIDRRLGGFAPGQMVVVAGRPGMGKTAFGLSLARRASRVGGGVGYISLEMPKADLWHRLLSDEANQGQAIPYKNIGRGNLNEPELDAVRRANERLKKLPLIIRDRGNRLSDLPGHIRAIRQRLEAFGKPLNLLVVDYLGLVQASDRYSGQRVNEVGEISATIKALAMREGICIMALHQLNRANEGRDNKRPQLSDLRDSGNIEQDADVVMFVYRDAYYIERGFRSFADEAERITALDATEHKLEVIVAKQRQGEVGACHLWVDMATNAVRDEQR